MEGATKKDLNFWDMEKSCIRNYSGEAGFIQNVMMPEGLLWLAVLCWFLSHKDRERTCNKYLNTECMANWAKQKSMEWIGIVYNTIYLPSLLRSSILVQFIFSCYYLVVKILMCKENQLETMATFALYWHPSPFCQSCMD